MGDRKLFSKFGDLPGELLVAAMRRLKATDQAGFAGALARWRVGPWRRGAGDGEGASARGGRHADEQPTEQPNRRTTKDTGGPQTQLSGDQDHADQGAATDS